MRRSDEFWIDKQGVGPTCKPVLIMKVVKADEGKTSIGEESKNLVKAGEASVHF